MDGISTFDEKIKKEKKRSKCVYHSCSFVGSLFLSFHNLMCNVYTVQNVWIWNSCETMKRTKDQKRLDINVWNWKFAVAAILLLKQSIACKFTAFFSSSFFFFFSVLFFSVLFEEYCAWGCDEMKLYGLNIEMILQTGWNILHTSILNIYKIHKIVLLPCLGAPKSRIRKRHGKWKKKWTKKKKKGRSREPKQRMYKFWAVL